MTKRLWHAFLFAAALSAALLLQSVRAHASDAELVAPVSDDPPGATCYHFPLITVCCDGGGCYILR